MLEFVILLTYKMNYMKITYIESASLVNVEVGGGLYMRRLYIQCSQLISIIIDLFQMNQSIFTRVFYFCIVVSETELTECPHVVGDLGNEVVYMFLYI